jgi:hypothetical protein
MTSSERQGAGSAALAASVLLALSLACTLLAVRWFTLPNLLGFSGQDVLAERDFWCVLASVTFLAPAHALALMGVALSWGRHQRDAALERSGFRSSATEPSPRTRSTNRR